MIGFRSDTIVARWLVLFASLKIVVKLGKS